ncbi:MAG: Uma2 family endonuclease [bacterium]
MSTIVAPHPLEKLAFTYEDYLELPDDGRRHEIIDGELFMSTAPTPNHQKIVFNLLGAFFNYLKEHPVGKVFPAPVEVFFSETNIVQPDIVFVSNERTNIIKPAQIQGAPDLVVEVLSPGTEKRDRTVKMKMYAKFGVREYWMAKEETGVVEVLRLKKGRLDPEVSGRYGKSQKLTSPLFPGLEISVHDIFAI